jgi:hypothetical protein
MAISGKGIPTADEIRYLAFHYDKNALKKIADAAAASGDPLRQQMAVLAGFKRDQIAKQDAKPPTTTVADDLFNPAPQAPPAPSGIAAAPGAPGMQMPPQGMPPGPPSACVAGLPSGITNMAGGGIVAFDEGGEVPGYAVGGPPQIPPELLRPYTPETTEDSIRRAGMFGEQLFPESSMPVVPSAQESTEKTKQFLTDSGVDLNLATKQKGELEKDRSQLKLDREDAITARILEAAAGVLGGTSQYAAVNIGKGTTPAIQGLASDMKDLKKADRDLSIAQRALDSEQNKFNMGVASASMERVNKAEDRLDKARQNKQAATASLAQSFQSDEVKRETARLGLIQGVYSADKGYESSKLTAGASMYATDKEEREIQKVMADRGIGYADAVEVLGSAKKSSDRYNAIRTALNSANRDLSNDITMMGLDGKLTELYKNPDANAAKITAIEKQISDRRQLRYAEYGIGQGELNYLRSEADRLNNRGTSRTQPTTPPANLPAGSPEGSQFGSFVPGKGWEIKNSAGVVIGYGQQ